MAVIAMGKIIEKLLAIPADALSEDKVARIVARLTKEDFSLLRQQLCARRDERRKRYERESANAAAAARADIQFEGSTQGMSDFYDAEVGARHVGSKKELSFFDSLSAILAEIERKKN